MGIQYRFLVLMVLPLITIVCVILQSTYLTTSHITVEARNILPECLEQYENTTGGLAVNTTSPSWRYLLEHNSNLDPGGHFKPRDCNPKHKVAIIVPYRDRPMHIRTFLMHMHPFLQRQHIDYRIFVIEQELGLPFNRGLLMNIGYNEANKIDNFTCFIFHDVDLIPENNRIKYTCPSSPVHMSAAVSTFNYRLQYNTIFGGVCGFTNDHFKTVNGFSNVYFGWGAEDDDLYLRASHHHLNVSRFSISIARYKMLDHKKAKKNPSRVKKLKAAAKRFDTDGLNNLKYAVLGFLERTLYTWVYVTVNETFNALP